MADDNSRNHLSNLPNRGTTPPQQGTDPLAELARLIGQNDPFSEFGRGTPAQTQQRPMPSGQQLAGQPVPEVPEQAVTASTYQIVEEAPTFAQAPRDRGDHRETAYRDLNQMPPGHDVYDEPEPRGRGRGLKTAMAVIALALVGIVGAFGYRLVFSGPSSSAPPPVIKANSEPAKVPPPAAINESSQNKLADRVGDRSQPERVVSREEPPVDAKDLTRPITGRNQPPPSATGQWAQAAAPNLPASAMTSSVPASGPPATTLSEPKKVRTVPIRPEPSDANMAPPSLLPPGASASANTPPARSTSMQATPNTPAVASNQARPPVPAIQPMQPPGNAPLSLSDDTTPTLPRTATSAAPAAPRQAPVQQQAPVQLQATARQPLASTQRQAAATPSQVAPATSGSGFLVQVSSQRSEADAQAALRTVQTKFSGLLSGQKATIKRADLGERGTFYRAMIGPFASREQATQLCGSLKAAGGDCLVQAN